MNRLVVAFKALSQLGFQPVALNALYRLGLATGHYRRAEKRKWGIGNRKWKGTITHSLFTFPSREQLIQVIRQDGLQILLAEADEIAAGKVRLFGGKPVSLQLALPGKLEHWTAYETGKVPLPALVPEPANLPTCDVKLLWEPARFGWAFTLGRAYRLSGDEKYAEAFWRFTETFLDGNPPCFGPNWMSGQETALRLMAFVWAAQVFAGATASTPERLARLADSVAAHAGRIPPTLVYARSQQNNHLLTEAAGLLTAGLALPDHPDAARWRALGWRWLNQGLQAQIDSYGEYAQHSTNYHRLMLQVVLWADALLKNTDLRWPRQTLEAIKRSIHWLLSLMDSESGRTPNLGANDGAYIFPFTICPFSDYRPVLHAAARAFLDYDLPRGPWDEMALWFGLPLESPRSLKLPRYLGDQIYGKISWAYLRMAQYTSRPFHSDQLHLDLWWRGLNVAQDAGTYLYNAPHPWENSLTTALVHNTVTVDGRDQMTRAGRFLYLDWVNAYRRSDSKPDPASLQSVVGRYRNYRQNYRHTRTVAVFGDEHWRIEDKLLPLRFSLSSFRLHPSSFRLHWLLPDWKWDLENREERIEIRLKSPHGPIVLSIHYPQLTIPPAISLVRAGETVYGSETASPIRGWASPTYGVKVPALSLAVTTKSANEVQFISEFIFP